VYNGKSSLQSSTNTGMEASLLISFNIIIVITTVKTLRKIYLYYLYINIPKCPIHSFKHSVHIGINVKLYPITIDRKIT
jgi:hypothetical protein